MPIWDVLVGDARGDVKHNDTALSIDVVAVAKTAKLLLARSVPDIKLNLTQVLSTVSVRSIMPAPFLPYRGEAQRVHLYTQCCDVLLLELSGQMTLDEGSLQSGPISV